MTKKANQFTIETEQEQEQKEQTGRLVTTEPMRNIRATMVYGRKAIDTLTTRRAIGDKTALPFEITYTDTETGQKIPKIMTLIFPTDGLQNDNANIVKLFSIITGKIAEVPFNADGTPQATRFTFSVHDLQKLCGCKSLDTVYDTIHKLKKFMDNMTVSFDDKGATLKGFKHTAPVPIYREMELKEGVLTVTLSKEHKTGMLYNYNTIIPLALYSLNGKPLIIAQHILSMACQRRQRESLKKRGYFVVTIKDIIKAANLPDYDEKKLKERVKEPILETLENMKDIYPVFTEIDANGDKKQVYCFDYKIVNKTTKREVKNADTYMGLDNVKNQPLKEWIKNDVRIYFRGETLNFYRALAQQQSKQIKYNKGK